MNGSSAASTHSRDHSALATQSLPPSHTPVQEPFLLNQWMDNRALGGTSKGLTANSADMNSHGHHSSGSKAIRSNVTNPNSTSSPHAHPYPARVCSYHPKPPSDSTGYPRSANEQHTFTAQTPYTPVGAEPHDIPRAPGPGFLFPTPSVASVSGPSYQHPSTMFLNPPGSSTASGPSSWQYWTNNVASNVEPEEYMSSANALMQLGGHGDQSANGNASTSVPTVQETILGSSAATDIATAQQRWPLIIFGNEQDATGNLSPHD